MSGAAEMQRRCLAAMGIDVWVRRGIESPAQAGAELAGGAPAPTATAASPAVVAELAALREQVSGCEACELHHTRNSTVFGVGDPAARCMVIGEAPGAEEDRRGEPFVGRAGKLLDAMLRAMGYEREQVYIANIVKCRPPKNRDPRPDEVACCARYLRRQIELIAPRVILAVGRVAAQNLLGSTQAIGRLRGTVHHYEHTGVPVVVTYHPAYLLRSPQEKRKVWKDLKQAQDLLGDAT